MICFITGEVNIVHLIKVALPDFSSLINNKHFEGRYLDYVNSPLLNPCSVYSLYISSNKYCQIPILLNELSVTMFISSDIQNTSDFISSLKCLFLSF